MTNDVQPWQRPPFEEGNALAVRHGAHSRAIVEPRAQRVLDEILTDESLAYLQSPAYASVLRNWANVQARAEVYGEWIASLDIEAQTKPLRTGARAPLELYLALVNQATRIADRCGLTPLSRARLGRDVVAAQSMSDGLDSVRRAGREAAAARVSDSLDAVPGTVTPVGGDRAVTAATEPHAGGGDGD